MSNSNRSRAGSILSVLLSVSILAVTLWVVLNRQYVFDQWSVSQYQPTESVAKIASNLDMSEKGRFYFYASQPAVNAASDFNPNCRRQEAQSAILGCYSAGRIYIFDVSNTQLEGIEEVTAAHEMLHAAWDRMSESEKKTIGTLLEAEYQKLNNPELRERMAYYDRNEPGEHLNELHSIIATEITTIDPLLEAHYKTYFSDRSKVLAFYNRYEAVFSEQETRAADLIAEVTALKTEIESAIATYNSKAAAIDTDIAALRSRESTVDRTKVSQVNSYNADAAAARVKIRELSTLNADIVAKQDVYSAKVAEYNALIVKTNELTKSLDSTLQPIPSL